MLARISRRLLALVVLVCAPALPAVADVAHHQDINGQIAAAEATLNGLQRESDALAERYDVAVIAETGAAQRATAAQQGLATAEARLTALRAEVAGFAASAYMGGGLSQLNVLTSGNPQSLVDALTSLDLASRQQAGALAALQAAELDQRQASIAADQALATQQAAVRRLGATRRAIEASAGRQERVLHILQVKQAALIRAARIAAARAAAQRRAAAEAAALAAARAAAARAAQLAAEAAATSAAQTAFASGPVTPGPVVTGSGGAAVAVQWAYREIGKPYVWGAAGPDAFDCSGLTQYVWGRAGVYLPHYAAAQYDSGTRVSQSQLAPGDLVFFPGSDGSWSAPGHVGIYVGNGMMIDAPYSGADVREEPIPWDQYVGAVNPE